MCRRCTKDSRCGEIGSSKCRAACAAPSPEPTANAVKTQRRCRSSIWELRRPGGPKLRVQPLQRSVLYSASSTLREGKQRPGRQHQACVTPQRVFRSGHISTRPSVQCAGNNSWQGANDTREGKKPAEPPVRTLTIQPIAQIQHRDEYPEHDRKVKQSGVHRHAAQRHATHQCNRANARQPTPPTASKACSTTTTLG